MKQDPSLDAPSQAATIQRLVGSAAAAFLFALVLRLVAVLALGHYLNPTLWENGVIAGYLIDGCGFCMDFSRPGELSSWQTPAYPFLLAVAWRLFGRGAAAHLVISLIQACALASMVFPVRWIARRWCGERAGTAAMWLTTVMPLYIWYATRLHQAGFVMAAHPWLIGLWLHLRDRPGAARGLLAGAASGLAGLLQPILLLLSAAIGAALLAGAVAGRQRRAIVAVGIAALAAMAVLTPWTVRNWQVHGRLVPIRDSFGKEFWMGNNPHATGTGYAEGGAIEITYAYPPKALALKGRVPEIAAHGRDVRRGVGVRSGGSDGVSRAHGEEDRLVLDDDAGAAGAEQPGWRGAHVPVAAPRLLAWVLVLAALALVLGPRIPREYALLLALYVITYSVVYGITHVGQARYRGEMEFVVLPLVAAGLVTCAARIRRVGSSVPRPSQRPTGRAAGRPSGSCR